MSFKLEGIRKKEERKKKEEEQGENAQVSVVVASFGGDLPPLVDCAIGLRSIWWLFYFISIPLRDL